MLGLDLQGDVFVDDFRHQITQLIELVNVPGIHQYAVGQGTGLITAGLVSLVEQRAHLRVFGQHHAIEVSNERLTTAFKQWNGGADDGAFFSARSEEHTSELQSLMRISYAVFCLHKKKKYVN